jgi:hypothetical protein
MVVKHTNFSLFFVLSENTRILKLFLASGSEKNKFDNEGQEDTVKTNGKRSVSY